MPREDWVILLEMPVEDSFKLLKNIPRKKDIHESEKPYLDEARRVYLKLASRDRHWLVINCVDKSNKLFSKKEIHDKIIHALKERNII